MCTCRAQRSLTGMPNCPDPFTELFTDLMYVINLIYLFDFKGTLGRCTASVWDALTFCCGYCVQ